MTEGHAAKGALRKRLLASRAALAPGDRLAAGQSLCALTLGLPEVAGARTVAAYVSVGREPATRELIEVLRARGVRVLLPVVLPDKDLDWAEYSGPESLEAAGWGLLEPVSRRLGTDAILAADAVLLPGLAVDQHGLRLGRGGGCYDRVLARLARRRRAEPGQPALVVLVYDGEVVERLPGEPHDMPVDLAVTPSGVRRFPAA